MSARPSVRRSRLLAAATLVVLTGTAALAPATAFAEGSAQAGSSLSAPSVNNAQPLTATLEQVAGQTPLVRGGATELKLTVTNDSDQEQKFHPTVTLSPTASAQKTWTWVEYQAAPISAPVTNGSTSWAGDNSLIGGIVPPGGMNGYALPVPAHTTYTWKITVKVKAGLSADNEAVKVTLANDLGNSTVSAPLTLPVAAPTGALVQSFRTVGARLSYTQPVEADVILGNNGKAVTEAIAPKLRIRDFAGPVPATFKVETKSGDTWTTLQGSENTWQLPAIDGGLDRGAAHTYKVRVTLTGVTGQGADIGYLAFVPETAQGPIDVEQQFRIDIDSYVPTASPSPSAPATGNPGTPATTAPNATPTRTAQVVPAALTSSSPSANTGAGNGTSVTTDTTPVNTALASTGGGGSSTLLIGAGGALVLLGAGSILIANRRRTNRG